MATPHVSAGIAMIVQAYKGIYGYKPTPEYIKGLIINTSKKIYDSAIGLNLSRIDVYNAVFSIITPHITVESPLNKTYNTSDIDFNITVNRAVASAVFSINNNANSSMKNDSLLKWYNTSYILEDGYYNVTFYVRDADNNSNSAIIYFAIDTSPPKIDFVPPTPGNNKILNTSVFIINISINESNPSTLILYLNDSIVFSSDYKNWVNITLNLSDGRYEYYVWVNDSATNTNQTEKRNITIDTTMPTLSTSLLNPNVLRGENITFYLNASDNVMISRVWYVVSNGSFSEQYFVSNSSGNFVIGYNTCLLYTSPSPRD